MCMNKKLFFTGDVKTTWLGEVWIALSERGLVCVEYGVSRAEFESTVRRQARRERYPGHVEKIWYEPARVDAVTRQIKEYLEGKRQTFNVKIDWSLLSSDFQRVSLKKVFSIPYGETRTYTDIATQIGHPDAPRAVGRANATNPMPLVIPCHRVIGTDGKLHGYGGKGGIKTKAWLLKFEKENK